MKLSARPLALIAVVALAACSSDDCRSYSKFTCDQLQDQQYNVYYYEEVHQGGEMKETFLGEVHGLNSCGTTARTAALAKEEHRQGDWSYICCLKTDTDSCMEKHR